MFRLIYTHNTRLDLATAPHESSLNFIDYTLVRPTLDKSSDTETESAKQQKSQLGASCWRSPSGPMKAVDTALESLGCVRCVLLSSMSRDFKRYSSKNRCKTQYFQFSPYGVLPVAPQPACERGVPWDEHRSQKMGMPTRLRIQGGPTP